MNIQFQFRFAKYTLLYSYQDFREQDRRSEFEASLSQNQDTSLRPMHTIAQHICNTMQLFFLHHHIFLRTKHINMCLQIYQKESKQRQGKYLPIGYIYKVWDKARVTERVYLASGVVCKLKPLQTRKHCYNSTNITV